MLLEVESYNWELRCLCVTHIEYFKFSCIYFLYLGIDFSIQSIGIHKCNHSLKFTGSRSAIKWRTLGVAPFSHCNAIVERSKRVWIEWISRGPDLCHNDLVTDFHQMKMSLTVSSFLISGMHLNDKPILEPNDYSCYVIGGYIK